MAFPSLFCVWDAPSPCPFQSRIATTPHCCQPRGTALSLATFPDYVYPFLRNLVQMSCLFPARREWHKMTLHICQGKTDDYAAPSHHAVLGCPVMTSVLTGMSHCFPQPRYSCSSSFTSCWWSLRRECLLICKAGSWPFLRNVSLSLWKGIQTDGAWGELWVPVKGMFFLSERTAKSISRFLHMPLGTETCKRPSLETSNLLLTDDPSSAI